MGQRVDTECGLLNEEDSKNASIDEATHPVTPSETSHESWHDQSHEQNNLDVVLVLPDHDWIFVQVRNVGSTDSLWVLLHDHPADMRVE